MANFPQFCSNLAWSLSKSKPNEVKVIGYLRRPGPEPLSELIMPVSNDEYFWFTLTCAEKP